MVQRIGELLIAKGFLRPDQLEAALEEQGRTGEFLGKILVRLGHVTEENFLKALAEQFHTRFVSLKQVHVSPAVLKLVPKSLVWEYKFLPVEMRSNVMLIAVSNPLDMWPMSALQQELDLSEVQIVLAKQDEIVTAILKHYGPEAG